jgi:hypothetical protein
VLTDIDRLTGSSFLDHAVLPWWHGEPDEDDAEGEEAAAAAAA